MTNKEAIEMLETICGNCRLFPKCAYKKSECFTAIDMAIKALEQPKQKKGKWIRITQGAMPEQYICPFCHRTIENYGVEELLSVRYPYCHCGADMRGDDDG